MHSRTPGGAELALQELRRLVQGIRSASYSVESSCGVTGAQLFVLRELALEPGASIRRLSERTLTDASSVSVIVTRLVEAGLVLRTLSEKDRRKSALTLTSQGEQLLKHAPEPYQSKLIGVLRALPDCDVETLRAALSRMSDSLGLKSESPLFFEPKPRGKGKSRGSE